MTPTDRVLDALHALEPELLRLTSALIQVPSLNPGLAGEDVPAEHVGEQRANELVADELERYGLTVHTVGSSPQRPNVVGYLEGRGDGPSLAFNAHVDTVPVGDATAWTHPPWSGVVSGDAIWGRGAIDDKGGLAAAIIAIAAIGRAGVSLEGDLLLHSVCGEELAESIGTPAVLDAGYVADACINIEPTADVTNERDIAIVPISNGALVLRVTLRGRRTHTALRHEWLYPGGRPDIGVNAVELAVDLVKSVQSLERDWGLHKHHPLFPPGKFVLHPGYIHGGPLDGSGPYYPAEHAVVEYIIWFHPDEAAEEVRDEVSRHIAAWAEGSRWLREHPPELEWLLEAGNFSLPLEHGLMDAVSRAHREATGREPPITGFLAGSDAAALSARGIPTLIYGPGEIAVAHALDEHVLIAELTQAARVYALAALNWCGVAES